LQNELLFIAASKSAALMLIYASPVAEEIKYSSVVLTSAKFFTRDCVFHIDQTTFGPLVVPWRHRQSFYT